MDLNSRYSDEELEQQYNLRARRPDYDSVVVPDWTGRSQLYRENATNAKIDLAYGPGERDKLDYFPALSGNGDLLVYLHGGYWQRGDKSAYSFLADPFVRNGVSVAIVNYNLCPSVRISEITPQVRAALAWLWRKADELGFSKSSLNVIGHSAGGHLTSRMMSTDWSKESDDLPIDMIKTGIPVSALIELPPLIPTSINDGLHMDLEEAIRESPENHPPVTNAPQLVVVGGNETEEFHRQSDDYCEQIRTNARQVERYSVPDADHFDELNELADENSVFFKKVHALITA